MNSTLKRLISYLLLGTSILLCACGGSNSLSGIDGSGSPISAGNVSTGAINGFGSVIVNGVRYNSDKAKILINDQLTSEDNLRAGYQVKVTGSINKDGSATADTIEFNPNIVGTISNINLAAQQLTVLNQLVQINNTTLFDIAIKPGYLEGLKLGDTVLVSGAFDDKGVITATRIELNTTQNIQAMGYISNLNQVNFTFSIRDLTVNYSAASLVNFNNLTPANNSLVVVNGSTDAKGVLQAKSVRLINNSLDKNVKSVESEGFITRFTSSTDFDVAGTRWTTSTQTQYEDGTSTNLALGVAIRLKGEVNSAGLPTAQKVEFENSSKNEIAGEVTNLTIIKTDSITTGTLQISGTTIQTNSRTVFEDKGGASLKRFNFSSINIGDFLKVSGYNNQGVFIATKIERADIKSENETELKLNGIISSINSHSFMLYDRTIFTTESTEIKDNNGTILSEAQFYLQATGKRVKVKGALKNGIFTAKEIEFDSFENDD